MTVLHYEGRIMFREVQKVDRWWVRALMLVVIVVPAWAFVQQIVLGEPFGNRPAPD